MREVRSKDRPNRGLASTDLSFLNSVRALTNAQRQWLILEAKRAGLLLGPLMPEASASPDRQLLDMPQSSAAPHH